MILEIGIILHLNPYHKIFFEEQYKKSLKK